MASAAETCAMTRAVRVSEYLDRRTIDDIRTLEEDDKTDRSRSDRGTSLVVTGLFERFHFSAVPD
ncbi:hypothetical protein EP51_03010 [Rhodococcus opacus]|uniref:Uncharacterized protein n=1 Tax=Rhodococcus opacus TaxID=37919 RepID=A0A076EER3_RHOOP|nr:hypothetical protein EP51_03010 [Rhodococcus opacus]